VISMRRAGLRAPKTVVWRQAFKDADGTEYDLDSNLRAQPSTPLIERDDVGNVKSALFHNDKMKRKFIASAEKKGKRVRVIDEPEKTIQIPNLECQLTTGLDLRRLAVKMAVGTARYLHNTVETLDQEARMFLLGRSKEGPRVLRDVNVHANLESLRDPLAHLVYVEGSRRTSYCYGIVQLYGLIQMYVVLNDGSYSGSDFAGVGLLSPLQQYSETFKSASPMELPRPSEYHFAEACASVWGAKFNRELKNVSGEDTSFRVESRRSVPSNWVATSGTAQRTRWVLPSRINEKDGSEEK
jgi:hypothetical protein